MLYSILFGTLAYLSHAQPLPTLTDNACTANDVTKCSALQTTYGGSLSLVGITGEMFACGEAMGYCTLTCNSADTCGKLTPLGISSAECISDGGVNKCIVSLVCTTSDDCNDAAIPLCVNPTGEADAGICDIQTPAPTDPPVTKQPTVTPDPNATKTPTGSPTTAADRKAACYASCSGTDPMYCEADEDYAGVFQLTIDCENVANECQAQCLVDYQYEINTRDLSDNYKSLADTALPDDLVAAFCGGGTCTDRDTPSPTITKDDGTDQPTTTEQKECEDACASYADDPMYCQGEDEVYGQTITVPCTDVRNECEAECLTTAVKTELIADVPSEYLTLVDSELASRYPNGLVAEFCQSGSCDDEPTTTEDPCLDPYYDNPDECPPETGSGCGVQFNVTIDFCVLNRKFKMRQLWRYLKRAYVYAIDDISTYSGFCDADVDLSIERWSPGYTNPDAALRGKKTPKKKRDGSEDECDAYEPAQWADDDCCEDIDEICGSDRKTKQFRLGVDTFFSCGDCDTMRYIAVEIVDRLSDWDAAAVLECLGQSVSGDTVCTTGFGDLVFEIEDAVLAYRDENDNVEIIAATGTGGASGIKYGLALIVAFIMATIY